MTRNWCDHNPDSTLKTKTGKKLKLQIVLKETQLTGNRLQTKQCLRLSLMSSGEGKPGQFCLVVGESQGSYRRSTCENPVKPPRSEGDSRTIDAYHYRNN